MASGSGALGEPLADRMKVKQWPVVLSHSWSQLVALGQGPILLTKLVPLTFPIPVSHGFFLAPAKS